MISADDISAVLREFGIGDRDTMFVHSDVRTSLRVEGATVPDKLGTIASGLRGAAPEGAVVVPTFSYSFTDGHEFDVDRTGSTVGAFSEWFRSRPGVRRTPEPIFSVAVDGDLPAAWAEDLFAVGDVECFGPRSIFAYLHEVGAKLVCWGVDLQALTFVHYAERLLGVPYRFPKDFRGTVRAGETEHAVTARYQVRELNPGTEVWLGPLAEALLEQGRGAQATVPDGPTLFVTDTAAVLDVIAERLRTNPDFLILRGHELAR